MQVVGDLLQQGARHQDLHLAADLRHRVGQPIAAERPLQRRDGEAFHVDGQGPGRRELLGHRGDGIGIPGRAEQQAEEQDQGPVAAKGRQELRRGDDRLVHRQGRLLKPLVEESNLRHA